METETETETGIGILSAAHFFPFVIKQPGPAETLAVPGRRGEKSRVAAWRVSDRWVLPHARCDESWFMNAL